MQGNYLYMEDRGESGHQRWGTPKTPLSRKQHDTYKTAGIVPRSLIALDKAALGVAEDWRDRISLKCAKRMESSVRVVARFRPPSAQESHCPRSFRVITGSKQVEALDRPNRWEFDEAFGEECTQEAVYNAAGYPVISGMLDGYNGTIFAYGQTGSGKTHCMFGQAQDSLCQSIDHRGIVPRAAQQVFDYIRDTDGCEFVLRCSLFEVYREQLRDLLDTGNPNLRIKETPRQGVFVDGLAQEYVACEEDVVQLLRAGSRLRAVAATRLNQHSSRSHVIFSLTCEQKLDDGTEKLAKLNLVDLAGSEKVAKSNSSGVTLEEAKKINLSLSALGNVINALASRTRHVPYRNSKLTRILQETLGGNFKTALVVTCSPLTMHNDETLSSLNFATRAKAVCNHVKMNFVYSAEQLMAFAERLQQELLTARREIAKHTGGAVEVPPSIAAIASGQAASLSDAASRQSSAVAPPSSAVECARGPCQVSRVLSLADLTERRLQWALKDVDSIGKDMDEVRGLGLAQELRSQPSSLAAAEPANRLPKMTELRARQRVLQMMLKRQCEGEEHAARLRNLKELKGRCEVLTRTCEGVDVQLTQMQQAAADVQNMTIECHQSHMLSPRSRRASMGSNTTLQDLHTTRIVSAADLARTRQQSSVPPSGDAVSAAAEAVDGGTGGTSEENVESLRRELEMLQVDAEREEAMRHLLMKEDHADRQHWYRRALLKLRELDQSVNEEQHLMEILERRRADLVRSQETVRQLQRPLFEKEQQLNANCHLDAHAAATLFKTSPEDVKLQTRCQELDNAIARLREVSTTALPGAVSASACGGA